MKAILIVLAILASFTVAALAQPTNAGVAITPEQMQKIDSGLQDLAPLLPAKYQGLVNAVIGLVGVLAIIGRIIVGWRNNRIFGVIAGLFGGTNQPTSAVATPEAIGSPQPAKGATLLKTMAFCLLLGVACLMLAGCAGPHQYVANESGTGMKLKLPVGYNGNNVFEIDLTLGTFKNTALIQPVSTNRVYTPSLAVAAATRGKVVANAMNTGTNATMNVIGGDSYLVNTGTADGSITNNVDAATHTYQDAPAP